MVSKLLCSSLADLPIPLRLLKHHFLPHFTPGSMLQLRPITRLNFVLAHRFFAFPICF